MVNFTLFRRIVDSKTGLTRNEFQIFKICLENDSKPITNF